jgi:transcriptional regulator GlxA family with amidase domain
MIPKRCETSANCLRDAARAARRMGSVCSGACLLAATGLLDERQATPHWCRAEQLDRQIQTFGSSPIASMSVTVTSGPPRGISAAIDLALVLIADDLGDTTARRVAQEMVVYHRRAGGQSRSPALAVLASAVVAASKRKGDRWPLARSGRR